MDQTAGVKRPRPWGDSSENSLETDNTHQVIDEASSAKPSDESPAAAWFSEKDFGINLYLTAGPGFQGVIKQRFSDFIVQEIAKENGAAVRLTDLRVPIEAGPEQEIGPDGIPIPLMVTGLNKIASIGGAASAAKLRSLLLAAGINVPEWAPADGGSSEAAIDGTNSGNDVRFPAPTDKDVRKSVHVLVRSYFPMCESGTENSAGTGQQFFIAVKKGALPKTAAAAAAVTPSSSAAPEPTRDRYKGSRSWPSGRPNFLRFVLHKRNYDTSNAIHAICRATGLRDNLFGYAGLKDRRGVTTQHITAFQVAPERIIKVNTSFGGDILIGNFSYVRQKLRLGDLGGNRFCLVIRNVGSATDAASASGSSSGAISSNSSSSGDDVVSSTGAGAAEAALTRWAACGHHFINYFGLQRFGTGEVPTHDVGKAMLQRQWDSVVNLLLLPRAGEKPEVTAARQVFATSRDATAALAVMPRYQHIETSLLKGLVEAGGASQPGASLAACGAIPHRNRTLYLHAYQSSLWNRMATLRLETGGFNQPIAGDLVYASAGTADVDGDEEGGGEEGAGASGVSSGSGEKKGMAYGQLPDVKVLTEADVASGAYSITDVLLPLPGYAVKYPGHGHVCSAAAIAKMLKLDGFTLTSSSSTTSSSAAGDDLTEEGAIEAMRSVWHSRNRDYQLCGGYRRMVETAQDVEWSIVRYSEPNEPLATTDRDLLPAGQWTPPPSAAAAAAGSTSSSSVADSAAAAAAAAEGSIKEDVVPSPPTAQTAVSASDASAAKPYAALKLSFSLSKSAYATMVLRELMKVSTAKADQAALNDAPAGALAAAVQQRA